MQIKGRYICSFFSASLILKTLKYLFKALNLWLFYLHSVKKYYYIIMIQNVTSYREYCFFNALLYFLRSGR
jgi:hypothetical protein